MNIGHIAGGTNAGWRIVKQPKQWTHDCLIREPNGDKTASVRVTVSSYSCPLCGARRPS